jgi:hypothetical protein
MAGYANVRDLLTTQPAEGLAAVLKVLAGFTRIVARLRANIQWRPLLQDLVLEVDAIGDVLCKQDDLTASIRIAPEDRLGVLRTLQPSDSTFNSESANRQRSIYHSSRNLSYAEDMGTSSGSSVDSAVTLVLSNVSLRNAFCLIGHRSEERRLSFIHHELRSTFN